MNKKEKSFWMYTIILFTVALVLILLALVLSGNKGSYKSRIQELQNENLTLKNENLALENQKTTLEVANAGLLEKERSLTQENEELKAAEDRYANAVEAIYIADGLCEEGRYREAKETIKDVDREILKEKIRGRFDRVKAKIDANVEGE